MKWIDNSFVFFRRIQTSFPTHLYSEKVEPRPASPKVRKPEAEEAKEPPKWERQLEWYYISWISLTDQFG
jgi:hypothetical protein